jgi:TetR/AcrR family transcriptional regulator
MAEASPRVRNPAATRAAILDAAEQSFCERGLDAACLSDIAQRAGVTKSLIHHHFRSKADLWSEVVARRFAEYRERQSAILDAAALGASEGLGLEESARALFTHLQRNPEFVRLHAWMNAGRGGGFRPSRELVARGVGYLASLQEQGRLRPDVAPASILVAFFNLIEHWFQARSSLAERFGDLLPSDSAFLEDLLRILSQGTQPCPPTDPSSSPSSSR